MIIDMHCHLDLYPDPFDVAMKCGDEKMYVLSVTTTPKAWNGTLKLEQGNSRIRTALGLHPQLAHERYGELDLFDSLLSETRYVGEIGLDGGKGFKEHWEKQLLVFRHILKGVTKAGGKVMSIHSRSSASEVLNELRSVEGVPILHWFTGSKPELKQAIALDCWYSVGPAMLTSKRGRELLAQMPKDRVLTESDGPFAKVNRKPLMPWDAGMAVKGIADVWGIPELEAQKVIVNNFKSLVAVAEFL